MSFNSLIAAFLGEQPDTNNPFALGTKVLHVPCRGAVPRRGIGTIIEEYRPRLFDAGGGAAQVIWTYGVKFTERSSYVSHCCLRRLVDPGVKVEKEVEEVVKEVDEILTGSR